MLQVGDTRPPSATVKPSDHHAVKAFEPHDKLITPLDASSLYIGPVGTLGKPQQPVCVSAHPFV